MLVSHSYRRAVSDVELTIANHILTVILHRVMSSDSVAQIDGLACLASREERSIAARSGLDNFVLRREEVCLILTGHRIYIYHNAFLLVMHFRLTHRIGCTFGVIDLVKDAELQRVFRQVVRVTNNPRNIITLEFKYQLDVITQIILTQSVSKRQLGLILTTDDTTHQAHFSQIPDAHTR